MKDSLKPILIVVMLLMMTCDSEAAKPQGLLQRLIKIKYNSELYLVIKTKEANKLNKPEMADSALAVYNTIRWTMDGLVYQLSGDMVAANSPKKFKQMNNWALSNTAAVASAAAASFPYTQTLQELESLSQTYLPAISLISENQNAERNINLTTNVFYLIKDSYTLLKGLSDLKTQKTMALVDILDQMRLTNPQELLKQVKGSS